MDWKSCEKVLNITVISGLNEIILSDPDMSKYTVSQKAIEAEWAEVQAAQANPARFRPLYERYYNPIFRFIYQRTAKEELAADLTAQTFLKAMQNLKKYKFKGVPFSAWLFRIASNEVALHFRKSKKAPVVTIEDHHIKDIEDEIEDKQQLEVNIETLELAIQDLNPEEVELIRMRFFEKRPFKEVSEIMGITENNAKVRLYRLLKKLKKLFEKHRNTS